MGNLLTEILRNHPDWRVLLWYDNKLQGIHVRFIARVDPKDPKAPLLQLDRNVLDSEQISPLIGDLVSIRLRDMENELMVALSTTRRQRNYKATSDNEGN